MQVARFAAPSVHNADEQRRRAAELLVEQLYTADHALAESAAAARGWQSKTELASIELMALQVQRLASFSLPFHRAFAAVFNAFQHFVLMQEATGMTRWGEPVSAQREHMAALQVRPPRPPTAAAARLPPPNRIAVQSHRPAS